MSYNNTVELKKVKVLVVDDHTLFAEGTVSLLSSESRISVVGIAKNGIECMSLIRKSRPDVVLLDIKLPDVCGTDLIDTINEVIPRTKILMLTGYSPKGYVTQSMSKGANGFLLKDCAVKEMIEGILRVYDGGVFFSEGLEAFLHPEISSSVLYSTVASAIKPTELLTIREKEIIELVSKGLHNKEIASVLDIKVRTVNFHVSNILLKLEVNTRLEAVLRWANINNNAI
ncbi:response regulator transcription factor [Desulfosporosinus sp. PR]|uniref:response regulator transcription factor n=1 Tax=Candidatus Desulfosporosinus nitrosoreducens TaxID=3401928 RepID=UPI0027F724C5|nr:response regulator transcription factor [Desulfosporosinus sp. PR]MDQ7092163.1 response regulator transcription factor [Desulfosporosinus sp. PR]